MQQKVFNIHNTLLEIGFIPCHHNSDYPTWLCYDLYPPKGEGQFRFFHSSKGYSISLSDFKYFSDLSFPHSHEDSINIILSESNTCCQLTTYPTVYTSCTHHNKDQLIKKTVSSDNHLIKFISVSITPKYLEHIHNSCGFDTTHLKSYFVKNINSFENRKLAIVLNQLKGFDHSVSHSNLYYDSKLGEITCHLVDHLLQTTTHNLYTPCLTDTDRQSINEVETYIHTHINQQISIDKLCRIACMGRTKIKACFKCIHYCSISDYIQEQRLVKGQELLKETDLTVKEISSIVGYKKSTSFSTLIKNKTGLLPSEFRYMIREKK